MQGSDRLELEQGLALVKFLGDFSCPNEVFHKRQFIMQIIVNFRDYDDRHEKNTMARNR